MFAKSSDNGSNRKTWNVANEKSEYGQHETGSDL